MNKSVTLKRLFNEYTKKYISKIGIAVFFSVLVAASTSSIAWLLDPAIEKIFMARSADSALKLGQARGVALLAAASAGLPIAEYEAKKIKQAIVGSGAATKAQIQHMVEVLLSLQGRPQQDAADALAIALCHVHTSGQLLKIGAPGAEFRRGRLVDKSS